MQSVEEKSKPKSSENTLSTLFNPNELRDNFIKEYDRVIPLICPYDAMVKSVAASVEDDVATIVDLGCGTGEVLFRIYKEHSHIRRFWGIDADARMLEKARSKFNSNGLSAEFIQADFTKYPLPLGDLCVSSLVIHHFTPEEQREIITDILGKYPQFIHFDVIKEHTDLKEKEKFAYLENYMQRKSIPTQIIKKVFEEMAEKDKPLTLDEHIECCLTAGARLEIVNKMPGFIVYLASHHNY